MNQNFSHDQTSFSQQAHLTDYLNIIRKRKWVVITFFLVVVFIVTVKTLKTTPVYEATAQIIIEAESSFMDDMTSVTNLNMQAAAYYETQYKILESRSLSSKVIEDLRLGEFVANKPQKKPDYLTLALKKVRNFIGTFLSPSGHDVSETQSKMSREQGKEKQSEYVPKKRDWLVDWYLSNLEILPIRETNLVNISFFSQSPEIVARIANAHARAFIERNNEVQYLASQQALDWLKTQLRGQKIKVGTNQQTLSEYKYEQLKSFSVNNETLFSLPEIKQNYVIQEFRMQLAKLKTQKLEMATKYGPKHPKIIEINSSIKQTEQEILDEVNRIRMSIKTEMDRAEAIAKSIQQTQDAQQVGALHGEKDINYNILQLETEGDQEIYDILLKQAKEINLTGNMERQNIRIVDEAEVPHRPVEPRVFVNIFLSVVMGLTFGIGFAFFFEYMGNATRNPEDIMQHLGIPVIGVLPYDKALKRSKTFALPFNESRYGQNKRIGKYAGYYNVSGSLVAGLPVGRSGTSGQILMVESTTAGEGKSTVLAKSAISLARGGLRVVMVDADLPRSSLHELFGLKNNENGGLVNAMTGILSQKIRKGDLNKCSVDDLFSLITFKKQSGQLIITNDKQSIAAIFDNGRLFHIQSQECPDVNRLGSTLLRGGFITESQLKDALERNQRTGQPLGYILINAGYITQDKLQGPLKLQAEETLQRVFSWKQGTFAFKQCTTDIHEDKRLFFQEDYVPIINRLSRTAQSNLIESEVLSLVKSVDEPNLSLLTAGIGNTKAEGSLYFGLLAKILDILKKRFDVVLVDAPPVLPAMGYVMPLVSIVDGVIFVVKSGHVSVRDINKATTFIKEAKGNIIGTILNQVKIGRGSYNDYYGYYK